jgi:hypothetical protein
MLSSIRLAKPVASPHGVIAVFLLGSLLLIMPACGGGSSSNLAPSESTPFSSTQSSQPSNTQVLVGMVTVPLTGFWPSP